LVQQKGGGREAVGCGKSFVSWGEGVREKRRIFSGKKIMRDQPTFRMDRHSKYTFTAKQNNSRQGYSESAREVEGRGQEERGMGRGGRASPKC